jgi:hypothetical protein
MTTHRWSQIDRLVCKSYSLDYHDMICNSFLKQNQLKWLPIYTKRSSLTFVAQAASPFLAEFSSILC